MLLTPRYVDANTLKITLTRASLPFVGRLPVYVYNPLAVRLLGQQQFGGAGCVGWQKWRPGADQYYHAGLDYYFLTGRTVTKAALDQVPAWARTSKEIRRYLPRRTFADVAAGAPLFRRGRAVAPADPTSSGAGR